jgi:hypothetical protein
VTGVAATPIMTMTNMDLKELLEKTADPDFEPEQAKRRVFGVF